MVAKMAAGTYNSQYISASEAGRTNDLLFTSMFLSKEFNFVLKHLNLHAQYIKDGHQNFCKFTFVLLNGVSFIRVHYVDVFIIKSNVIYILTTVSSIFSTSSHTFQSIFTTGAPITAHGFLEVSLHFASYKF